MAGAAPARPSAARPVALWVSPVSNLAGVARHIIDAAGVGLPGWQLTVACPEGPLAERLRELGVPVHTLEVDAPVPQVVANLRRIITAVNPDVVHSHLAKADFLVAMAAPRRARLVSTEHHIQEDQRIFHGSASKASLRVAAHRVRLRRFDQLIAVSASTRRDMLRHWKPGAPITVVLNGVDRPASLPARAEGLRFLSLTRLSAEKNLATTLRVFAVIHEQRPEARLTVGGTGPEEDHLRQLAHDLGITEAVTFAGFVDASQAMATHDVLLQPSRADNLSYTLLDAVAQGMGVSASNIGGNSEILPERCLAGPLDVQRLAAIALEQAQEAHKRPQLPAHIPTCAQMTEQIVAVYTKSFGDESTDVSTPSASDTLTFASNQGDIGGGEVMLFTMAETARDAGYAVRIVGPKHPGSFVDAARARGFHTDEIAGNSAAVYLWNLRRWDARERQGLLWCNGLRPALATAGHRVRVVHLHQVPAGRSQPLAARLASWGARAVLVPSHFVAQHVPGSRVLRNWTEEIKPAAQTARPRPPHIVGYLGRLSPDKGIVTLCAAVEILVRRGVPIRLLVAGESRFASPGEATTVKAALAKLGDVVDQRGWVEREDFFSSVDLAVFPSQWDEAFGLVAAEAMAAECPFVVSDAGALPEVVGPDHPHRFRTGDANALADVIEEALAHPDPVDVSAARERWESHYSPRAGRDRLVALLQQLGSERDPR